MSETDHIMLPGGSKQGGIIHESYFCFIQLIVPPNGMDLYKISEKSEIGNIVYC